MVGIDDTMDLAASAKKWKIREKKKERKEMTNKGEEVKENEEPKGHAQHVDNVLLASQTARQITRLAANRISEYELYDKYMTTFGAFIAIPNPKGDIARNIIALKKVKLLIEEPKGIFVAEKDALAQLKLQEFNDLTSDIVESAGFRGLFMSAAVERSVVVACCSTSTSCKCSSSSCSSSVEI